MKKYILFKRLCTGKLVAYIKYDEPRTDGYWESYRATTFTEPPVEMAKNFQAIIGKVGSSKLPFDTGYKHKNRSLVDIHPKRKK